MKRKAKSVGAKMARVRLPRAEKIRIVLTPQEFSEIAIAVMQYELSISGPLSRMLWERRIDGQDARNIAHMRRWLSACGIKKREVTKRLAEYRAKQATERASFLASIFPVKAEPVATVEAPSGEEAGRG